MHMYFSTLIIYIDPGFLLCFAEGTDTDKNKREPQGHNLLLVIEICKNSKVRHFVIPFRKFSETL